MLPAVDSSCGRAFSIAFKSGLDFSFPPQYCPVRGVASKARCGATRAETHVHQVRVDDAVFDSSRRGPPTPAARRVLSPGLQIGGAGVRPASSARTPNQLFNHPGNQTVR